MNLEKLIEENSRKIDEYTRQLKFELEQSLWNTKKFFQNEGKQWTEELLVQTKEVLDKLVDEAMEQCIDDSVFGLTPEEEELKEYFLGFKVRANALIDEEIEKRNKQ
ncbi:hypothetical protein ACU3L3_07435 [Priestia endophytica]